MNRKTFYFDCETTGLDPKQHEITQLAYIITVSGEAVCERSLLMRPLKPETIIQEALNVQGRTREQVMEYAYPHMGYVQLLADLGEAIDKYNKDDKLTPVAYNAQFDLDFLRTFFESMGDKYLGSWIDRRKTVDPLAVLRWHDYCGRISLPSYSLGCVCEALGVAIDKAHDAMADVRALQALVDKLHEYELDAWMRLCAHQGAHPQEGQHADPV